MNNILNIFPIKIKYCKSFLNKKEANKIILKIKKYKHNKHYALIGDAISSHSLFSNILKDDKINNKLNIILKEYSDALGIEKQFIFNSWTNIQKKGSILNKHNHPSSSVSGALYLKVDSNSNKIYFYNPNPYAGIINIKLYNESNFEYVYFQPEIGDLILFPSWLLHGSNNEINKSKERIVLSFNTIDESIIKKIKEI